MVKFINYPPYEFLLAVGVFIVGGGPVGMAEMLFAGHRYVADTIYM